MESTPSSPADSRPLFSRRSSSKQSLSLDLSNIPPLVQPTPPSNTLLFTNLQDLDIFRPDNLQTIRELIAQTAPIHAWSPLKSFRRIVVSFYDEASAIVVRQIWDGESILGNTLRVYFGAPTAVDTDAKDRHLALPDAGKLFFISPPPSPPHDWEMRLEDAPNKLVHAEDLAEALARLHHHSQAGAETPVSPVGRSTGPAAPGQTRSRSSTLLYRPDAHGTSPDLPAICLEDMTDEPSPIDQPKPIMAHTARPPVELMHDA
ncbi:Calcipressin-domain-containing protein [Sodiomyces alkalinus F11]|uniref:Calcipressin-domain-containing protein n=1 Tax=Sodiomyces alkalinus (strain CBS 110278 / VKM F-3762 / F11) TaxID=1314773 RepID=A0A3N2Q943_SODAK|nr:Calcipressin-domain-containing protein [Sodiomyces alkalinus F11]ROT43270.1 Calcipressin-domain-containing protein [Sodiomyces alkalinus F11]